MTTYSLDEIARLPLPGDNVAIATRRLDKGTQIHGGEGSMTLDATVLEGHRFALARIGQGEHVNSWNLPFGTALRAIEPGEYICNEGMLEALEGRSIALDLPEAPNFVSEIPPFQLDENQFTPGAPTGRYDHTGTFQGYARPGGRGTGTRNYIVLLGTSSLTGGFVRALERRLQSVTGPLAHVDGIVAVAHTEGGVPNPNNLDMTLRTLAGFMVHPNIGAILAVDYGTESISNARLRSFMEEHGYPLGDVTHAFLTIEGSFEDALQRAEAQVRAWFDAVNASPRTSRPVSDLKLALQCGGSDAFSGISGNPLAAWVAREIIRHGGAANLAETDELIGAEAYVLQNVRDFATARRFLDVVERFKRQAARHGHSAEGNPSGGNKFRGLYNIFLKSIGAAMKRNPDVRLDWIIEYGELMSEPGYYFMDSPGNDLESIAGQVAAGGNLIFFVTGNGSITNFPFVPTVKIVTTSERFALLERDMDVNAGAFLDGTDMDDMGRSLYDRTLEVAGGRRTVGEQAGHSQIQLWRNWPLDSDRQPLRQPSPPLSGKPIPMRAQGTDTPRFEFTGIEAKGTVVPRQTCLIVPTSLCSGQIADLAVRRMNRAMPQVASHAGFATIVHHEGCGVSSGSSEELYARTLAGYIQHPQVKHCLLLEHGCEKTHNDFMRNVLETDAMDTRDLGWASVQLDGGIVPVLDKMEAWFRSRTVNEGQPKVARAGMDRLRIAIAHQGELTPRSAALLARCVRIIAARGGLVVVPEGADFLPALEPSLLGASESSLAYAQAAPNHGLQIMETPTRHWVETLSGLGATGVDLVVVHVAGPPVQGHPLIPTLQISDVENPHAGIDLDLVLDFRLDESSQAQALFHLMGAVLSGQHSPRATQLGNVDFQITRGPSGISL